MYINKLAIVLAIALLLACGAANAALVLVVDDPTTDAIDLTVVDGGANDQSRRIPGLVSISTTIGGVPVNAAGVSKPSEGSAASPVLSLNYAPSPILQTFGLVNLKVTDTGFNANLPYEASVTGSTGGTLQFDFFGDSNNQEFGKSFDIGSTGALTGTFDPQLFRSGANPVGSLTISADIVFTGFGQAAGFASTVSAVPLPAALPLFASALAGLGILRWRHRQ
jgi:hypothetical protein